VKHRTDIDIGDLVDLTTDRDPPDSTVSHRNNDTHAGRFWRHHDKEAYECPRCGTTEGWFDVHHLDGNHGNGSLSNLVALCRDCHSQDHEQQRFDQHPVVGWKNGFRQEVLR